MFFYTDGVTEATNAENKLYGDARLLECLDRCGGQDVSDQLDTVKKDIDAFVDDAPQFDDITIMAMKIS